MTSHPPLLLTVKETAQLLRIHRPKVYDLIRDRIIDGFKLGSDWRVKRESVEKLVGPIPDDFFGTDQSNSDHVEPQQDSGHPKKVA
jgi:excisionase family DNA binding protein